MVALLPILQHPVPSISSATVLAGCQQGEKGDKTDDEMILSNNEPVGSDDSKPVSDGGGRRPTNEECRNCSKSYRRKVRFSSSASAQARPELLRSEASHCH